MLGADVSSAARVDDRPGGDPIIRSTIPHYRLTPPATLSVRVVVRFTWRPRENLAVELARCERVGWRLPTGWLARAHAGYPSTPAQLPARRSMRVDGPGFARHRPGQNRVPNAKIADFGDFRLASSMRDRPSSTTIPAQSKRLPGSFQFLGTAAQNRSMARRWEIERLALFGANNKNGRHQELHDLPDRRRTSSTATPGPRIPARSRSSASYP